MKLVLFDIDGTLLLTSGAGRRAMERALAETVGTRGSASYHYDGKTDRQIVRDLMRLEGHEDPHIDTHMSGILDAYLAGLSRELHGDASAFRLLAGVTPLLDALEQRPDVVLGLLTGNVAIGAAVKLRGVGIDPARFRVNAFGSDHEQRNALAAIAQERASDILGVPLAGDDIVVIGDTPADIACGKAVGARTIGVATGRYSVNDLLACQPSAAYDDLSNTAAVVATITS